MTVTEYLGQFYNKIEKTDDGDDSAKEHNLFLNRIRLSHKLFHQILWIAQFTKNLF